MIGIEELVRWAWVEELSKVAPERRGRLAPAVLGYGKGWAAVTGEGRAGLGALVNRYGSVHDASSDDEVAPDALSVASAVAALDDLLVEAGDVDWFGSWGGLGPLGEAALARAWALVVRPAGFGEVEKGEVLQGSASSTVVRVAITGIWPDWRGIRPSIEPDLWPNGSPKWLRRVSRAVMWDDAGEPIAFDTVEADGFDRRAQRPYRDAWRAMCLKPDPAGVLAERIRWAMIHAWFSALASALDGLGGRVVLPPPYPAAPWSE